MDLGTKNRGRGIYGTSQAIRLACSVAPSRIELLSKV